MMSSTQFCVDAVILTEESEASQNDIVVETSGTYNISVPLFEIVTVHPSIVVIRASI